MRFIALGLLSLLAACATGPSRGDVLVTLVGRPEADAIRVFGAPNRVLDANGSRFLAWDERRVDYTPAPFGYGFYFPATIAYDRTCITTVEIVAGNVRGWTLRGNGC